MTAAATTAAPEAMQTHRTRLHAAVRITLAARHVDTMGWLAADAVRQLQHQLDNIPAYASVTVDLGALHKLDEQLVALLTGFQGKHLTIESSDWRLAGRMIDRLVEEIW